jgi:hypothetical protein
VYKLQWLTGLNMEIIVFCPEDEGSRIIWQACTFFIALQGVISQKIIFTLFSPFSSDISSALLSLKPSGYVFCLTANNLLHSEIC